MLKIYGISSYRPFVEAEIDAMLDPSSSYAGSEITGSEEDGYTIDGTYYESGKQHKIKPQMTHFENVYSEYYTFIRAYLQQRCNDYDTAEDLTQEVFIKVFKYCPDLDAITNKQRWLTRIAENTFIDYTRKKRVQTISLVEYGKMCPRTDDCLIERQFASDQLEIIFSFLNTRSEKQMLLLYSSGYSQKEIAYQLGLSPQAVRMRIFRMRKQLHSILLL